MEDFKQYLEGELYSRQEELTFWDCDCNKRARMATLLSKMAAFGGYHYDALGFTHEVLAEAGFAFLLSRVAIHIHHCPRFRDVLTVNTWENGTKGVHTQRVFQMRDQTGRLCVSARSDWILADPNTHKLLRPSSFTLRPYGTCPVEIDCPEPRKLVMPKEGLTDLGARQVVWSDLDGNGHLFSGNYGDIIWDTLPAELQGETPVEFYINYNREATLGDRLQLEGVQTEHGYQMEAIGPNGTCFTALCVF